jgi:hypothetical protein
VGEIVNKIIRGIWSGPTLTNIQKLCIQSYIDHGHEFHLYISEPTSGVPEKTVVHQTSEISPVSDKQRFALTNHYCDYLRVLLIQKEGGWYVDLDTVCLRTFDFLEPYVFISENEWDWNMKTSGEPFVPSDVVTPLINNCIFKSPAQAVFLEKIIQRIHNMDTLHPKNWIAMGPALFREVVPEEHLQFYVKPPVTFDALCPNDLLLFVSPDIHWNLSNSYTLHLRTSGWVSNGLDANKQYPENSLFEQLKRKHNII